MSDISISLPLSIFGDNASFNTVVDQIRNLEKLQRQIEQEKKRADSYRDTMLQWAAHLQSILDQDVDDFLKRQNLRQFARDTKEFANQIERINQ